MTAVALDDRLRAVAASGLAGSPLDVFDEVLDTEGWAQLLAGARAQRLVGLLQDAVDSGAMAVTDDQAAEVSREHVRAMSVAVSLDRVLLETVDVLARAGIDHRVLKGAAHAHLDYRDPSLRSYHDVDLLVPADSVDRALVALTDAGYQRRYPRLDRRFDARFGKSVTLVSPGGSEVDVHRSLAGGRFGMSIRLDDLFCEPCELRIGGRVVLALAPEVRFLHACYHAAVGDRIPSLRTLRDIAEMLVRGRLDTGRVQRLCSAWRGQAVVALAVRLTWETFELADVNSMSVWAQRYEPDRSELRALRAYTNQRSAAAQALTGVAAVPGTGAKVAFLKALVLPEHAFFASEGHGYLRWWRRGARSTLRLHRP